MDTKREQSGRATTSTLQRGRYREGWYAGLLFLAGLIATLLVLKQAKIPT